MNIIIPMAGLGTRFSQSGFSLPKPLIRVAKKPMYRYAVDCLPLQFATNLLFVIRNTEHAQTIEDDIRANYQHVKHCKIIKLEKETEGQAETILKCKDYILHDKPTLIHNCDTYIKENFNWHELLEKDIDGAIVLFPSDETRWSYAKLDDQNQFIIDFKEKIVISSHASTGTYYFKNTHTMLDTIQTNIEQNLRQNNEFYLSTTYQTMIQNKKKVVPLWVKEMLCFGTPEDLVTSLNQIISNGPQFHD